MLNVDLDSFAGGALSEKVNMALEQVVRNLLDPATPFKAKRKITIDMEFVQNESRSEVAARISCKVKLAPQMPALTMMAIGKDLRSGRVMAQEYGAPQLEGADNIVN